MNSSFFRYYCAECPESEEYRQKNCFTPYRTKHYERGEYIAYKGEQVSELSMLVKGSITAETILDTGLILTTRTRRAPFSLGSFALFAKNNHYRVNFRAKEEATVCVVSRTSIEDQMMRCRTFLRNYLIDTTDKLDIFSEHLTLLSHRNLRAKLAHYIFSRSSGRHYSFDKRIGELATYLCVERPSLSRVIAQLVDEGLITHQRGKGEILNEQALRELML